MKTIHYGSFHEKGVKYRPIAMYDSVYNKIESKCRGHYGFGGKNKSAFYVDVNDWEKAIEIVNEAITSGFQDIFVLRKAIIKL